MRRAWIAGGIFGALAALWPRLASAAGEKVVDLVVVADTRELSGLNWYLAGLYNESPWVFAVWAVVLTTLLGAALGLLMDVIMSRAGLDLGRGSHVEH